MTMFMMMMLTFCQNFFRVSELVCPVDLSCWSFLLVLCLTCWSSLLLFGICSSSTCSSVFVPTSSQSSQQLSYHLFFLSPLLFFSLLVSGVSRMGRLTAPGGGEDNSAPLQLQGVHSLRLDAYPFSLSLSLSLSLLTKNNNSI